MDDHVLQANSPTALPGLLQRADELSEQELRTAKLRWLLGALDVKAERREADDIAVALLDEALPVTPAAGALSSPAYTQAATPGRLSRLVACLDTGSDGAPVPRATAGAAAPGLLQLAPLDPSPGGPVRRGGAGGAAAASAAPAAAPAPAVDGSHVPRSGRASAAVRSLAAALIPTALMRGPAGGSRDASEDARMASARAKVRSVLMAAVTTGQLPRIPGIVSKSRKQANAAARKHLRALMEMGARGELDAYRRGIEQPVQQPLAPAAIAGRGRAGQAPAEAAQERERRAGPPAPGAG
ncbi:hypothetical protein WJX81_000341 [Elliptochloris bilobata]|uniref:Uncharacterized protein n=1 Tax=Elliptochloris bilobata TaxID=381761 RepID=A0AAW1RQJ9_9CHLO